MSRSPHFCPVSWLGVTSAECDKSVKKSSEYWGVLWLYANQWDLDDLGTDAQPSHLRNWPCINMRSQYSGSYQDILLCSAENFFLSEDSLPLLCWERNFLCGLWLGFLASSSIYRSFTKVFPETGRCFRSQFNLDMWIFFYAGSRQDFSVKQP